MRYKVTVCIQNLSKLEAEAVKTRLDWCLTDMYEDYDIEQEHEASIEQEADDVAVETQKEVQ